jgi:hypothetical protein
VFRTVRAEGLPCALNDSCFSDDALLRCSASCLPSVHTTCRLSCVLKSAPLGRRHGWLCVCAAVPFLTSTALLTRPDQRSCVCRFLLRRGLAERHHLSPKPSECVMASFKRSFRRSTDL